MTNLSCKKCFCLAAALLAAAVAMQAMADDLPLASLKEKATAETDLGKWELVALGPRGDFPFFAEKKELEDIGAGRWDLPVRGIGSYTVGDNVIGVRMSGNREKEDQDKWVLALQFTAKKAGAYNLAGKLDGLWFDGAEKKDLSIKWAVVRIKAGLKCKVLAAEDVADGAKVNLGTQKKLKGVELGAGRAWQFSYGGPSPGMP